MKDFDTLAVGFLLGAMVALLFWIACDNEKDDWWRRELVRRGHAEYVVDQGSNLQWRWKDGVEK